VADNARERDGLSEQFIGCGEIPLRDGCRQAAYIHMCRAGCRASWSLFLYTAVFLFAQFFLVHLNNNPLIHANLREYEKLKISRIFAQISG
jgi:hypothetical protein